MVNKGKVLLVDDDDLVLSSYSRQIKAKGYHIDTFETVKDAIDALNTNEYDVGLIDMNFPEEKEGGLKIVNFIKQNNINTKAIILTGKGSVANFRKIFKDIFDYIEKDDDVIPHILNRLGNAMNMREMEKKIEQGNHQKTPIYQSTHTFEKCFNTPIRNICYRMRRKVPYYQTEVLSLIDEIDDSIDLWANQFSMELFDARYKEENDNTVEWIHAFEWNDFQEDFERFISHYFILNINDLFDHYDDRVFDIHDITLADVYRGDISWEKYISYEFPTVKRKDKPVIMGIRSYFRALIVNMISNAIEAMNFFDMFTLPDNKKREKLEIDCHQEPNETIITIKSTGTYMKENQANQYNEVIFKLAQEGNLKLSNDTLEDDIRDKRFTSKPGIGSGYALIHAANYFSRIYQRKNEMVRGKMAVSVDPKERSTEFKMTLPFGQTTIIDYVQNQKNNEYYELYHPERTYFDWKNADENKDKETPYVNYKKEYERKHVISFPDDNLSDHEIDTSQLEKHTDPREILIVEDARPDRLRMRMLINDLHVRYYRFAWDAPSKKVLKVSEIKKLIRDLQPALLILDLAWTPYDEYILNKLIFKSFQQISATKLKKRPHSFQLLDAINSDETLLKPLNKIIIVSQFIPPVANGVKEYIKHTYDKIFPNKFCILNKWRDESKFKETIIRHLEGGI
jgi:ActR/RegA family two-component response regulator